MVKWSRALQLTSFYLSPLRVFPDGQVTDFSVSLTTEGLPWWSSGLRHCNWLPSISHHWGPSLMVKWSRALQLTSLYLSPMRAFPDGQVAKGIATDFSLSLTNEGLPWWSSGLGHCNWLPSISHHWGPSLMVKWSRALQLTSLYLSPLRAFPDGQVV